MQKFEIDHNSRFSFSENCEAGGVVLSINTRQWTDVSKIESSISSLSLYSQSVHESLSETVLSVPVGSLAYNALFSSISRISRHRTDAFKLSPPQVCLFSPRTIQFATECLVSNTLVTIRVSDMDCRYPKFIQQYGRDFSPSDLLLAALKFQFRVDKCLVFVAVTAAFGSSQYVSDIYTLFFLENALICIMDPVFEDVEWRGQVSSNSSRWTDREPEDKCIFEIFNFYQFHGNIAQAYTWDYGHCQFENHRLFNCHHSDDTHHETSSDFNLKKKAICSFNRRNNELTSLGNEIFVF